MGMNRAEKAWVLYDVGNSAFVLVMVTAIVPIFFKEFGAAGLDRATSTAYWGYANSCASLVLALFAPLLGAFADYGRKKMFFIFFLLTGLAFTLSLTIIGKGQWILCLALFVPARIGWAGSNIFYDSMLVDVTSPSRFDYISTQGYGWGYVGSVIPFVAVIGLILSAGMGDELPVSAVKTGFLLVAVWWLLFSLPMIRHVHQTSGMKASSALVRDAFSSLFRTMREIAHNKTILFFLGAYFFYIDGVGTIISMSTAYGHDLGFGVKMLIVVLLFIQLVAFPFALLYGKLASIFSTRTMLLTGIGVFCCATMLAFLLAWITDPVHKQLLFWLVAFLIASSMGGLQALSRSYFGRLIPPEASAEYFGFYNVFGKFAAIVGPLLMGVTGHMTGDTRWGVLSILILFVIGGLLLFLVKEPLNGGGKADRF